MRARLSRDTLLRTLCLAALVAILSRGLLRTPEVAAVLAPQRLGGELVGGAEDLVVDKERERDARAALELALSVRLADLRAGLTVPTPDSFIDAVSLALALRRAHTLRVEADDDLLRAREKLARYKRLRTKGWQALRLGCPPAAEAAP